MDRSTGKLLERWLAGHPSANTRAAYGRDVRGFVEWCEAAGRAPLGSTQEDLDRYRDDCLAAGASPATVARRLSGLASFFRFAAEADAVAANPLDGVERPATDAGPADVLDEDEVGSLVQAARGMGTKAAALVSLLALEGMKLGEALAIDVPEVTLHATVASVAVVRHGEAQEVRLARPTTRAVRAHIGGRTRGPLFLGDSATASTSTRLTRFGADFLIKRAASSAGIDRPVSASVLRRSYVAAARRAGDPLERIADHVGHREARETARLLGGAP